MHDQNEGMYRGGVGGEEPPVSTACPGDRHGQDLVRVELESKRDVEK